MLIISSPNKDNVVINGIDELESRVTILNDNPNSLFKDCSEDVILLNYYHKMTVFSDKIYRVLNYFNENPRIQIVYTDEKFNGTIHHYYNIDSSVRNYIINPLIFIRASSSIRIDDKIKYLKGFDILHQAITHKILTHHLPIISYSCEDRRIISEDMKATDIKYALSRYSNA